MESEISNIDWSNPDVMRLFRWFKQRIDGLERDKQQRDAKIEQLEKEKIEMIGANRQLDLKCRVLQSEVEQLEKKRSSTHHSCSRHRALRKQVTG